MNTIRNLTSDTRGASILEYTAILVLILGVSLPLWSKASKHTKTQLGKATTAYSKYVKM